MNKNIIVFVIGFLSISLLAGCGDGFSTAPDGLRFKIHSRSGKTALPVEGEIVRVHYTITSSSDSIIYNTYSNLGREDRIKMRSSKHKGGDIYAALAMMAPGDSMSFLINADSFFIKIRNEEVPPFVAKGSDLKFTVKTVDILSEKQLKEIENKEKLERWNAEIDDMLNYGKSHGLVLTTLDNSVKWAKRQETQGKPVVAGSVVKFHFSGALLDDTEFVNTYALGKPASVKVGETQMEPAVLSELLLLMKEGEKAVFLLPFDLGFGAKGVGNLIPPYATLVYEINIVSVD